MEIQFIKSSSSGCCGVIRTDCGNYLLDCGIDLQYIQPVVDYATIKGVFITHEHDDHINGLKYFCKVAPELPIYGTEGTIEQIKKRIKGIKFNAKPFKWEDGAFKVDEITVIPVPNYHDAADPVLYVFKDKENTGAYATDLGHLTDSMKRLLSNVEILAIETNFDPEMEENSDRPECLKQRVMGADGHLSNYDVAELIQEAENPKWTKIIAVHLSKDCNDVDCVKNLLEPLVKAKNATLEVVDPKVWYRKETLCTV